ncbi:MAG: putative rRNA maturation factor [Candidatus Falkowbacteria bacterium GW2011_GWA2_39_24]|uniref:Endoribonuclease YbeY n=1 Tax=Candidatus Falkowbacteria bacterium GW2011_GWA2_39_24 TaxID=1618634 RepID=A0A0G0NQY8_9BACT|nr:MAG: putative rRNA maturation factor [Candidatus Falkowbacteria bacterium GW2011_GWA2_39_24]
MIEINNKTRSSINLSLVRRLTTKFLIKYRLHHQDISLVFVGDTVMRRLNKKWRNKDRVTDVLSFRDHDSAIRQPHYLGEIIIDYQQLKRQAKTGQGNLSRELIYILVHGLLHLVGYDDKTERQAKRMHSLGTKFINQLKI